MRNLALVGTVVLLAILALFIPIPSPAQNAGALGGTVISIDEGGGATNLSVTLDTPADSGEIVGMSVRLVIAGPGGQFTPTIGTVVSAKDATHCVVRVDPSSLEQTWQDPSDDSTHKVREYLRAGARIAFEGGRSGRRRVR